MCRKIVDPLTGEEVMDGTVDPLFPVLPSVIRALRSSATLAMNEGAEPPELEYRMAIESICGVEDDSQDVELYDGALGVSRAFVDQHQLSVGQIQWDSDLASKYQNPGNVSGVRWCSGVMISDDLFLTAGHCFDQQSPGWQRPRINGSSQIIPSSEIARNMHVNFNFQFDPFGNPRPEVRHAIVELIENRLAGLDFAIVRLAGSPGQQFGQAMLAHEDAAEGDMICIIGHPAGVPKRIEAGPALAPDGDFIRYDDIDTLGGNSGAGINRADDGRIVGVHTNGGCTMQSPNGDDFNFGVRITALLQASPTLQALIGA